MSELEYPDNLRYTADHEWIEELDGGTLRVGITSYAQNALGDVVYVSLPAVGDTVTSGETCGEVESTKSVSDLYAPLSGEITAVNSALDGAPELVKRFVRTGASPRGAQAMLLGAKVRALFDGRFAASIDDVKATAPSALRHRILLSFEGEAEGVAPDRVIAEILKKLPGSKE